jgi:predicted transcriptional regulator
MRRGSLKTQITLRLPPDLREALERIADSERRLLSDIIRMALEEWVAAQSRRGRKPRTR